MRAYVRFISPRQFCMQRWKVAGALHSPKGIRLHSKNPKFPAENAVYFFDSSSISICQNPDLRSRIEKYPAPTNRSRASLIRGSGCESLTVHSLSLRKSIQKRKPPSFFRTNTIALFQGLWLGWIAPALSISRRCSRTSSTIGLGILLNRSL